VTISAKTGYVHPCAIAATATAVPPHTITREAVKYYIGKVFDIPERRLEAMMSIVDNANVQRAATLSSRSNTSSSRVLSPKRTMKYIEHTPSSFGREATVKCLERRPA